MTKSKAEVAALVGFAVLVCAACVGSETGTQAPDAGGGGSTSSTGGGSSGYAGTYAATYSGTYVVDAPAGTPGGSNTATGTIVVTDLPNGEVGLTFQLPPNGPSGALDFALSGNSGPAVGAATGGQCFVGAIDGNTQTNCCTQCSITFAGNGTFSQPNSGTFTGTTAGGDAYSGTYNGTWIGTKQ